MELYQRIRKRREELGLSQEELAQKMGYKSRSSINKIEMGENDIPQSKIVQFARALNADRRHHRGSPPRGGRPLNDDVFVREIPMLPHIRGVTVPNDDGTF